ncbi:hypothetical protein DdX_10552 [Ditylenchus destructor]|uniref:Uncharacterized protein n=1 Tax=Ditylenchus destructor TaxID=166010 RepID=A0AAD4N2R3_9BILA|nr:hypothetical protein DdX_10552 [Ditylenchus destructor]
MAPAQFLCCLCRVVLDDSEIESHISAEHLDYFPFECSYCRKAKQKYWAATKEDMKLHIATNHNGNKSHYFVIEDDAKEIELKKLAKECRRLAIPQTPASDSNSALRSVWTVLNDATSSTNAAENWPDLSRVKQENDEDVIVIEDDDETTAMAHMSSDAHDELPETSGHAMEDQWNIILQSLIPTEEQEVASNFDFSRLNSINLYPGSISAVIENNYESNSSCHGTIEEAQAWEDFWTTMVQPLIQQSLPPAKKIPNIRSHLKDTKKKGKHPTDQPTVKVTHRNGNLKVLWQDQQDYVKAFPNMCLAGKNKPRTSHKNTSAKKSDAITITNIWIDMGETAVFQTSEGRIYQTRPLSEQSFFQILYETGLPQHIEITVVDKPYPKASIISEIKKRFRLSTGQHFVFTLLSQHSVQDEMLRNEYGTLEIKTLPSEIVGYNRIMFHCCAFRIHSVGS